MTAMNGKVALVTGAGSGIGLATAKAFAQTGASVVLADRQEDAVRAAAGELIAGGRKALAVRCDVTDDRQVTSMIDQTVSTFGRLDAAFNNAGVMQRRVDTADITDDEWDRVMAINLRGVWSCMKYELRQMLRNGGGAIVNCSSLGGVVGNPGLAAYHAAKHAAAVLWLCSPGASYVVGHPLLVDGGYTAR